MINKLETEVYKEECRLEVEDFMIWREKKSWNSKIDKQIADTCTMHI